MTQETRIAVVEDRALAIQELETRFAMAVRQRELLEKYIRERLKPDKHFYTIEGAPGRKPSLTKEGAELICLPHSLKPRYSVLSGPEKPPADNSAYQITINCSLWRGDSFEGEGIGSASSYITTKAEGHKPRQNDPGLCYNATLKMAQKSAYIAATLNSTAASEFFTQDLEDDQTGSTSQQQSKGHWCAEHKTVFFKKGKMKSYAHPIGDTGEWCHERTPGEYKPPKEQPQTKGEYAGPETSPSPETTGATTRMAGVEVGGNLPDTDPDIDLTWVHESLEELQWSDVGKWIKNKFGIRGLTIRDCIQQMSKEQKAILEKEIQDRLQMK